MPEITLGAGCEAELEPLVRARQRHGHELGVAWFDSHADLDGVLGTLLSRSPRIGGGRVALLGVRSLTSAEWPHVWRGTVRHLPVHAARRSGMVSSCVLETGADEVYLHVGLGVLGPGGLTLAELVAGIRAIAGAISVVGAGIIGSAPPEPLVATVGEIMAG